MNISVLKQERLAVEKMTGRRMTPLTQGYLERAKLAYMNLGGEGQLPAAVLICAVVDTNAMDEAYDDNATAQEVAMQKQQMKANAKARAVQVDAGIETSPFDLAAPPAETSANPGDVAPGQLCNYLNDRRAWLPCRYVGPGQAGHVIVEARDVPEPFEIPMNRFDVPDLTAPIDNS